MFSLSSGVASHAGRRAFADESDDRIIVSRGFFAVADGSGPTYGGYYAPLGMDVGLASILRALAPEKHAHRCDEGCLRAAFGAANADMHDLDAAYQRVFESEARKIPEHRLEASLRACQEIARTRLGLTLDTFAHFYASVSALHFTERGVVVAQVGSCRVYRWRHRSLELMLSDHTLETSLRAEGRTEDAELHGDVVTRMLGAAQEAGPDLRCETVEAGDRYVVSSDGAWRALGEATIARICGDIAEAQAIASSLIALVERSDAADDASIVVVAAA